jgi:lipopolysaccharide transport system ATP-binding protein
MYVRLGFAVAAHVEADVLLVDEVLAVGDSEFRRRCTERMEELRRSGTTLIFVSHNMYQVRRLCNRALLLVKGEPRFLGETGEAISAYEHTMNSSAPVGDDLTTSEMTDIPEKTTISNVILLDQTGQAVSRLGYDQELTVCISYRTVHPVVNPIFRVRLIRSDGTTCAMTASAYQPDLAWTLAGQGTVNIKFKPVQLASGRYQVEIRIVDSTDSMLLTSALSEWFFVDDPAFGHETERGVFVPHLEWSHQAGEADLTPYQDKEAPS